MFYHAARKTDAMRRGRASCDNGNVWAGNVLQDTDVPGSHINNAAWYEKRRHFASTARQEPVVVVLYRLDATNTGAHRYSDQVTILIGDFKTGVFDRLGAGRNAVMNKRVSLACFFPGQIVIEVEIFDHAADASRKSTRIEILDQLNTGYALTDAVPRVIQLAANRRDDTHAGDDDASLLQSNSNLEWQSCRFNMVEERRGVKRRASGLSRRLRERL